mmetsp:Transcript_4637/g.15037  ORF Transcript_4637/g.15037 Transcript_4637/m.15037 type:complete len:251 (+) Transcript_4637:37-789(+)
MLRPCGFLPTLGEYDSRAEAHAAQYLAARGVVSVADLSPAETAAFVSEMRGRSFEIHHGALEALVAEHRAERRLRGGGRADSASSRVPDTAGRRAPDGTATIVRAAGERERVNTDLALMINSGFLCAGYDALRACRKQTKIFSLSHGEVFLSKEGAITFVDAVDGPRQLSPTALAQLFKRAHPGHMNGLGGLKMSPFRHLVGRRANIPGTPWQQLEKIRSAAKARPANSQARSGPKKAAVRRARASRSTH